MSTHDEFSVKFTGGKKALSVLAELQESRVAPIRSPVDLTSLTNALQHVKQNISEAVGREPHQVSASQPHWTRENAHRIGAKGIFPLRLGNIQANLVGGPYRSKPKEFYGIKMAEEINADCVISIPTRDYEVPELGRLVAGLYCGITLAQQQVPIWVGCMGGIGRTGLYFAALAKVMAKYQKLTKHKVTIDPIAYTRQHYLSHAVETDQQRNWIWHLDVDAVAEWAVAISGYKAPWWKRVFR